MFSEMDETGLSGVFVFAGLVIVCVCVCVCVCVRARVCVSCFCPFACLQYPQTCDETTPPI